MFDVVVKNTILFTMFILAIHFLIKSRLLDEGFVVAPSMPGTVGMPLPLVSVAPRADAIVMAPFPLDNSTNKLQELHDYVFADEAPASLDDYFKAPAPAKHETTACDKQSMPAFAPSAKDLCASNVDKQFDLTKKAPIMETNHSFYKVYPNESVLNGGMMGNVMGFTKEQEYEQL